MNAALPMNDDDDAQHDAEQNDDGKRSGAADQAKLNAPKAKSAEALSPRSSARLAAAQALYQMDMAHTDVADVINEFKNHRLTKDGGLPGVSRADHVFFAELVRGVVRRQNDLDPQVDAAMAKGWRLARIDAILRAILRAGAFELIERTDVPARVVINEYIVVSRAFFDEVEPKVVNGVLDTLARRARAAELSLPAHAQGAGSSIAADAVDD
ncbi:MAG: transcription antitermination factor NusB [Pseudomonadota bacterium]